MLGTKKLGNEACDQITWVVDRVSLNALQITFRVAVQGELLEILAVLHLVDLVTREAGADGPRIAQGAPLQGGDLRVTK